MSSEIFLIISTIFSLFCYCNDYLSLYNSIISINKIHIMNENKQINLFSLRIRVCIFMANGCYVYYIFLNNIQSSMITFSIYLSLDTILLITRSIYAYIIHKKIISKNQNVNLHPIVVENPMLNII